MAATTTPTQEPPEIDYGHQMNPWARPRYNKEEQEHNDALKEQHTRHIAYASRFFKRGD